MSQTILIESNEDLKKIYSLNLNTFVGTDVIHRKNADETLALLRILPQISMIVTRVSIGEEQTIEKILDFLSDEGMTTPVISLGSVVHNYPQLTVLPEPISWETLIKVAAQILGVTIQDTMNRVKPDYIPVPVHFFYEINKTPCDIFIRIKKSQGDFQFVKRLNSKDSFELETIQKYEQQGLKEFYVAKDYIQYFTNFVTSNLVQKLERSDLTLEERILTTASAHEIVRDSVMFMDLDTATIELSEASINSMVKSVKDSPEVASLIKFLFSNKVSYAYQHCHLLALMCHYILSKQSWYKPEHLEILSFVSFFSDVTLRTPNQMQISSMAELDEQDMTDDERFLIKNHAKDAVKILEHHPQANDYVKTVLLQSHGTLDGVGFAENPSEELHPISKVFIIADTFVKILLNPHQPSTKKDILPLLYQRFTGPSYQKIIKALEQKFQ